MKRSMVACLERQLLLPVVVSKAHNSKVLAIQGTAVRSSRWEFWDFRVHDVTKSVVDTSCNGVAQVLHMQVRPGDQPGYPPNS